MKKSTRRGTRPQTPKEAKEIKRITHSKFPKAFNQDAHERNRNPDGTIIQPKTESIVNSYRDLGAILAEIAKGPKHGGNTPEEENNWNQKKADDEAALKKTEEDIAKEREDLKRAKKRRANKPPVWTDAQRAAFKKRHGSGSPGEGRGGLPPV
tara:strand:- start:205 stop:663 length:459 start_codon:yes stop_codon:yes gene_type:complete